MPYTLHDRIQENTTSTGTGSITLSGAVSGFRTFSSVVADGGTAPYVITHGNTWECGIGQMSGTSVLVRSVTTSSNSNNLVNFGVGIKQVFLTATAQIFSNLPQLDSSNNYSIGQKIVTGSSSAVGLTVQGVLSQSANLQEWKDVNNSSVVTIGPAGDLLLSPYGSTTSSPRVMGVTSYGSGEAVRWQFGDPSNSIQNSNAGKMILQSYWGMEIYGCTTAGTAINFSGGGTSDPALSVCGSRSGNVVLTVKSASGQTANLQEWQTSTGAVQHAIGANGEIKTNQIQNLNSGESLTNGVGSNPYLAIQNTAGQTYYLPLFDTMNVPEGGG